MSRLDTLFSQALERASQLTTRRHLRQAGTAPAGRIVIQGQPLINFSGNLDLGLVAATPTYPVTDAIGARLSHLRGQVSSESVRLTHANGLDFLRSLKGLGATVPRQTSRPLNTAMLKRVLTRLNQTGARVTYDIAYGSWQKPVTANGAFVTGTDTGVGKTLVSALLAYAWRADYWKPLQTGVSEECGDNTPSPGSRN